ncbi:LTA synthase family protein [Pseudobutyrivibrio sp. MD2005]|uniref:LTA synthase family protein n=1 Tax=Pseudobutyrivibrio sp. MD2005 TaxID=1410616 RepID=UPI000685284F|nr:sulfatase-like hydrolase/transferase [Pseudobutyrivibrio sp. MD2005]
MLNKFKDKAFRESILTGVKFLFAIILTLLTYTTTKIPTYLVIGLVELVFIFFIYNLLVEKHIGLWLLANLLFFIYIAQMLVLYFGNSYVTMTMLKNIKFLEDLGGRIVAYALGTILVLAIVAIRGKSLTKKINKKVIAGILVLLLISEIGLHFEYKRFSPVQSFATLAVDQIRYNQVKKAQANPEVALKTYYRDSLEDAIVKPDNLPENPNVIVIFTEGLSYNIISDERDIMPNLQSFEKQSLSFKNYYNHTFPTLRGVQGQLYSGYKLDDDEVGNNLISMQDIFKANGYRTDFINVEPYNEEFNRYCANLGFENVVTDTRHVSGYNLSMTDDEAYNFLYAYAKELDEAEDKQPFFLSIYTFGTHVSFDAPENGATYGNGKNAALNRFYNLDQQFGEFLELFNASDMADDTILIFTTDHTTYADQDYSNAFPDHKRDCTDVDTIPLYIYYKGIEANTIDVNGRNSLCLAPTVLDYLDIDSENYFLGTSLFNPDASSEFDTTFYDASYLVSTADSQIRYLDDLEIEEFLSQVLAYYSALEADVSKLSQ